MSLIVQRKTAPAQATTGRLALRALEDELHGAVDAAAGAVPSPSPGDAAGRGGEFPAFLPELVEFGLVRPTEVDLVLPLRRRCCRGFARGSYFVLGRCLGIQAPAGEQARGDK